MPDPLAPITTKAELFKDIPGCGDNDCVIKTPIGRGTNSGCRCKDNPSKVSLIFARLNRLE